MGYRVLDAGEAHWRPSNQMGIANTDFGNLDTDVVALAILDSNNRYAVRLAIDDDETPLVGGQGDGGRVAWCFEFRTPLYGAEAYQAHQD